MTLLLRSCLLSTLVTALALAAPAQAGDVRVRMSAGNGIAFQNNTSTIDRFRVDEATGNISRNGALFVHTTGTENTFVGAGAGNTSTVGYSNSAFGEGALSSNTTGNENSAFGHDALAVSTAGGENSAFGHNALSLNVTGEKNAAFGNGALRFSLTSCASTAISRRCRGSIWTTS